MQLSFIHLCNFSSKLPVHVIQNGDQEVLIELKGVGELLCHLPDTVYELNKDGSSLIIIVVPVTMTNTLHRQKEILKLFPLIRIPLEAF